MARQGVKGVIFDLGGTLLDWPDWDAEVPRRWERAHAMLAGASEGGGWPPAPEFIAAMTAAEAAHWQRVATEHWSGPPSGLVAEGCRALGMRSSEPVIVAILDAYARAVDGTAFVFPDTVATLAALRAQGLRLALLSNTWWAAEWHNADLATHGLAGLLDHLVYTSDLPHSKPHPSVFRHTAELMRLTPGECVMVGDWPEYDIAGALSAGMRAVWKTNGRARPEPAAIEPSARIEHLAELPPLLAQWQT